MRTVLLVVIIATLLLPAPFDVYGQLSFTTAGSAASLGNDCFRLTPSQTGQAGAAWFGNPIDLDTSFVIDFDANFGNRNANGADGIALLFKSNATAVIGGTGQGIGYQGISPSVAVEFDTWQNGNLSDPAYDHVAITKNGSPYHTGANSLAGPVQASASSGNIEDGQDHNIIVEWISATNNLKVYFDCNLRLNYNGDIKNTVFSGNSTVYFGFTASTGGSYNLHQVCFNYISFVERPNLRDTMICQGQSVQLDATVVNGANYSWSPAAGLSCTNCPNPVATPAVTTTYTVTIMNNCNFAITHPVLVTIANPLPPVTTDVFGCFGAAIPGVTASGNIIKWYADSTASMLIGAGNTYVPGQPVPPGAYRYYATNTVLGCESRTTPATLTIGDISHTLQPLIICEGDSVYVGQAFQDSDGSYFDTLQNRNGCDSIITTALHVWKDSLVVSPDISICLGDTAPLVATGGNSYQWSPGSHIDNASIPNPLFFGNITTQLVVEARTANNCLFYDTVTVTVTNPLPPVTNDAFGCIGVVPSVSASGDLILWYADSAASVLVGAGNSYSPGLSALPGSYHYYATNTVAGCESPVVHATLSIGDSSHMNQSYLICEGDSVYTGQTYQKTAGIYHVALQNRDGCDSIIITTIQVWKDSLDVSPDVAICPGDSVQLTATGGSSYQWSPGSYLDNNLISNPAFFGEETTQLIVEGQTVSGCRFYDTVTVTVHDKFEIYMEPTDSVKIFIGESVQLNAFTSVSNASYQWYPLADLKCDNCSTATVSPVNSLYYHVVAKSENGCIVMDSVLVRAVPIPVLHVPTAFSPNGDGTNDYALVIGRMEEASAIDFSIFNRWGQQVFKATDPASASRGWDGTYKGEAQDMATYTYYLKVQFADKPQTSWGTITLVR